jgi:hypothetical protein
VDTQILIQFQEQPFANSAAWIKKSKYKIYDIRSIHTLCRGNCKNLGLVLVPTGFHVPQASKATYFVCSLILSRLVSFLLLAMYPWELGTLLIRESELGNDTHAIQFKAIQTQTGSNHSSRFAAKAFQEPLLDVGRPDVGRCASIEFCGTGSA